MRSWSSLPATAVSRLRFLYNSVPIFFAAAFVDDPAVTLPTLLLTVIDLSHLPALPVLGRTEAEVGLNSLGGDLQPVWPKPDVLVWAGGGVNYWWMQPFVRGGPMTDIAIGRFAFPWWGGSGGGQLIAFRMKMRACTSVTVCSPGLMSKR